MKTERKYFSRAEAEALVGKKIITLTTWSGVPKGTSGTVKRSDSAGHSKKPGKPAEEVFDVVVEWDLPTQPTAVGAGESASEPFVFIQRGGPLVDWFTKDEYEKHLREIGCG